MDSILENTKKHLLRILIISGLFVLIADFYLNIFKVNSNVFLVGSNLLFLSAATDGVVFLLHWFRRPKRHRNVSFDPSKLTVFIVSYNSERVIAKTIRQALVHVPPSQIIVVSDKSTDDTAYIARKMGVVVFENTESLNKSMSINHYAKYIRTEYTLILDDDTFIGRTFIPTSLLDDGYDAVAFNILPVKVPSLINALQRFEYRKTMFFSRRQSGNAGAVSNVSGAIGLFHTKDIVWQSTRHSGQYGGEDQQRTLMIHLKEDRNKGVAFFNALVQTESPNTWKALFKQRSTKWNCSIHENFILNLRIIFNKETHFLLKVERSYKVFLFATEPLRILGFFSLSFLPLNMLLYYVFYLSMDVATWIRTGRKDPQWLLPIFPFYNLFRTVARFIAYFWWFKMKYDYIVKKKFYEYIIDRNLPREYAITGMLAIVICACTFIAVIA